MKKVWCRNNLGVVGKWGGISFLFGLAITAFMFGGNPLVYAYVADTIATDSYQPTELKLDLDPIGKINDITLPVNDLINNALKGLRLNQNLNIGTGTPLSPIKSPSQNIEFNKFFSSSNVSSNDVMGFLKEAAITGINLSILIISITTQVLKGLLSVLR